MVTKIMGALWHQAGQPDVTNFYVSSSFDIILMELIMLNKPVRFSVFAAALSSVSAFAQDNAAGGVISFTGAITDTTCTINGGKSADFTIALSPITVTDAGTSVGLITKNKKSFSLTFSDCAPANGVVGTPLKIYFSGADNISTDGKYLLNRSVNENDSSVAKNVGFSLATPGSTTPIPLNLPYTTSIMGNKNTPESETLTLDVYYYKTNTANAKVGELNSSVTYTISYL